MRDNTIKKVVLFQGIGVILIAAVFAACGLIKDAYSALLGGMVCVVGNGCFILQIFARKQTQPARLFLIRFYWAEACKWILTAALFYIAIKFAEINALPFFATYLITQLGLWICLR